MSIERLRIQNFAGLKDVEIEVKKINILIGPQASGKSVIAKILFYFKGIIQDVMSHGMRLSYKRDFDKAIKDKFETYFPSYTWIESDFFLEYLVDNEFIRIKGSRKQNLCAEYSEFYRKSLTRIRDSAKRLEDKTLKNIKSSHQDQYVLDIDLRFDISMDIQRSFIEAISEKFNAEISFSQLFIPAGRSFFANLHENIFGFISENAEIDPFLVDFGKYYERMKRSRLLNRFMQESNETYTQKITNIKKKILCGVYVRIKQEDYLQMNDGRKVKISHASSGQQETLPLTMILESLPFFGIGLTGQSTYIEEPEAHLFPTAQKDIVDFIAAVYNRKKDRLQFLITTHSPYILTAFNNLLQAGILLENASEEVQEQVRKIVPDPLIPDEVAVYSVADGACQSIIDPETRLIQAEMIDSVSEDLAVQFDTLLDLE